jgi:hypothetical protein
LDQIVAAAWGGVRTRAGIAVCVAYSVGWIAAAGAPLRQVATTLAWIPVLPSGRDNDPFLSGDVGERAEVART